MATLYGTQEAAKNLTLDELSQAIQDGITLYNQHSKASGLLSKHLGKIKAPLQFGLFPAIHGEKGSEEAQTLSDAVATAQGNGNEDQVKALLGEVLSKSSFSKYSLGTYIAEKLAKTAISKDKTTDNEKYTYFTRGTDFYSGTSFVGLVEDDRDKTRANPTQADCIKMSAKEFCEHAGFIARPSHSLSK